MFVPDPKGLEKCGDRFGVGDASVFGWDVNSGHGIKDRRWMVNGIKRLVTFLWYSKRGYRSKSLRRAESQRAESQQAKSK
jgi:hypothetical protein